jgi:hypothetical protein
MADIKLGPSGSQVTLPEIVWPDGSPPDLPYEQDSGVEESRALDGSVRFNILTYAPGTWTLVWDGLTWADTQTIWAVLILKQELVYTNTYTDGVDHNVVVTARSYSLKAATSGATCRYIVSATLREVV